MKTVELPYYLRDQIIELIMHDDNIYEYKSKTIRGIGIENNLISLYDGFIDDSCFICFVNEIDSFKKVYNKNYYIFSSLDKMDEFIVSLRSN